MKTLLLLSLILAASCASKPTIITQEKEAPVFLTQLEISEQLASANSPDSQMEEAPATEEYKKHVDKLIPMEDFLPSSDLASLKKAPKSFSVKAAPQPHNGVDLRYRDTSVKSQNNGYCSAFALVAGYESTINKDKIIPSLDLSEQYLFDTYKKYSCVAAIQAGSKFRIPDEQYWPIYGKKNALADSQAHALLTDYTYLDDNLEEVLTSLDNGNVVYLAMATPKEVVNCNSVISDNTGVSRGGHALLIVGYFKDPKTNKFIYIVKNSWGEDCHDHGYFYIDFENYCKKSGAYCNYWSINQVHSKVYTDSKVVVPTPETPAPVFKYECKRAWYKLWLGKSCKWETTK